MLHIKMSLMIVVKKEQEPDSSSATSSVLRNGGLDLKNLALIVNLSNLIIAVVKYFFN